MAASKSKPKQEAQTTAEAKPKGNAPADSAVATEARPKGRAKASSATKAKAKPKAASAKKAAAKSTSQSPKQTQRTFDEAEDEAAAKAEPNVEPTPKVTTLKEQAIVERAHEAPARRRVLGAALERGDLFFFYRPDVDDETPHGLTDVRRLHIVMRPERGDVVRLLTVGRKTLPGSKGGEAYHWTFVDRVFEDADQIKEALSGATYETQTVGERHLPEARPAGEGVYALVRHGRDSILVYALELPEEPGEVQEALGIEKQGRFVVSMKNPEIASPPGLGLEEELRGHLPDELQELFGARKWHPADPPAMLDHQGIELLLIGGRLDPNEDLGIELEPQPEDEEQAEVFRDLHLDRSERAMRPLFEGTWA